MEQPKDKSKEEEKENTYHCAGCGTPVLEPSELRRSRNGKWYCECCIVDANDDYDLKKEDEDNKNP